MLRTAARIRRAPRPVVSAEFRLRSRRRFADLVAAEAAGQSALSRPPRALARALRPVAAIVLALLVVSLAVGGVQTASASALPGTPLYPAKLAAEQASLLVAFTPELRAQVHLRVATNRLDEAAAEIQRGNDAAVPQLLQSYEQQVSAAETAASQIRSTEDHEHFARAVEVLQAKQGKLQPVAVAGPVSITANAGHGKHTAAPTVAKSPASDQSATHPRTDHGRSAGNGGPPPRGNAFGHAAPEAQTGQPASQGQPDTNATPTAEPQPAAGPGGQSGPVEPLLKALIAQALAGNVDAATAASTAYVNAVNAEQSHGNNLAGRLRHQQARLTQALTQTPDTTSAALQDALNAIDARLAAAPSPGQSAAANPGATGNAAASAHSPNGNSSAPPTATAESGLGKTNGHGHSEGQGNGHDRGHGNDHDGNDHGGGPHS